MSEKIYKSAAERQAAYRERKKLEALEVLNTIGADGKYPGRKYEADGSLKLSKQHCDGCGGEWRASIEVPCPYCDGSGKRKVQDVRWAPVRVLESMVEQDAGK